MLVLVRRSNAGVEPPVVYISWRKVFTAGFLHPNLVVLRLLFGEKMVWADCHVFFPPNMRQKWYSNGGWGAKYPSQVVLLTWDYYDWWLYVCLDLFFCWFFTLWKGIITIKAPFGMILKKHFSQAYYANPSRCTYGYFRCPPSQYYWPWTTIRVEEGYEI